MQIIEHVEHTMYPHDRHNRLTLLEKVRPSDKTRLHGRNESNIYLCEHEQSYYQGPSQL